MIRTQLGLRAILFNQANVAGKQPKPLLIVGTFTNENRNVFPRRE